MQSYIDEGKLAGILTLVCRKGKVAHLEKFGKMSLALGDPMSESSIFRFYSMSKPIVSVALMTLYEQGLFQLNDPVSKFIPDIDDIPVLNEEGEIVKQESQIRIVDLLRHTSGFGYGWGPGSMVDSLYNALEIWSSKDLDDFYSRVKKIPLYHQPGTKWRYGISTDFVGYLVEKISGKNLREYVQENVLGPLEMKDTDFFVSNNKLDRFGPTYGLNEDGTLKVLEMPAHGSLESKALFSGGGGMLSTAADYLKFSQMLLNGGELNGKRILGRKTVELMTSDHSMGFEHGGGPVGLPNSGTGFGLGFSVVRNVAQTGGITSKGAYGWGGLAGTYFTIDPKEDLIIMMMIQLIPNGHLPLRDEFRNMVYSSLIDEN